MSLGKTRFRFSPKHGRPSIAHSIQPPFNSNADLNFQTLSPLNPLLANSPLSHAATRVSSHGFLDKDEKDDILPVFEERPVKFVFWVLVWASVSLALFAASGDANAAAAAAADSIRASSFGLKIASALRGSGWPDEAVVFALATLPVIELRGAIPVGYWLQLKPVMLTVLSVLGLVFSLCIRILIFHLIFVGFFFSPMLFYNFAFAVPLYLFDRICLHMVILEQWATLLLNNSSFIQYFPNALFVFCPILIKRVLQVSVFYLSMYYIVVSKVFLR